MAGRLFGRALFGMRALGQIHLGSTVQKAALPACSQGLSLKAPWQHTVRSIMTLGRSPLSQIPIINQISNKLLAPVSATSVKHAVRTKVYCSRRTGKPRNVKAVTTRFFRLHNGMWIRTRAGRNKKKFVKSGRRLASLQEHVFCNKTQCQLLDRMTISYFKQKKYYVNDPYEHYHKESNLPIFKHRKAPFFP